MHTRDVPRRRRWRGRGGHACRRLIAALLVLAALSAAPVLAAPPQLPLWPGTAPGSDAARLAPRIVERSSDPALPDRFADGIVTPSLTVYRPAQPDGRALLVVPGGGYQRVVLDKEGSALAPAFAHDGGLTLFVLQYRLPGEGHQARVTCRWPTRSGRCG